MATISKAIVDAHVREEIIKVLGLDEMDGFVRLKQKFLTVVEDENGQPRRVEISIKVGKAADKDGNAADAQAEIDALLDKQAEIDAKKEKAAADRAAKAKADAEKRATKAAKAAAEAAE
jgi:superfamily I DNA and RNA helicase